MPEQTRPTAADRTRAAAAAHRVLADALDAWAAIGPDDDAEPFLDAIARADRAVLDAEAAAL